MALLKLTDIDSWTFGDLIETNDKVASLTVGLGDGNWGIELDGTVLPKNDSPAWSETVTGTGSVSLSGSGQIISASTGSTDTAFNLIARTTWPNIGSGYFNATGLTLSFKIWNLYPLSNPSPYNFNVEIADGVKFFNLVLKPNGYIFGTPSGSPDGALDTEMYVSIIGNNFTVWVQEESNGLFIKQVDAVALPNGGADRFLLGDTANTAGFLSNAHIDFFKAQTGISAATPYDTGSPTITMGQIAVDENIDELPIVENNAAGGTITWDYDIGAGFVTGNTLAQLNTALVDTDPATLNLRANMNSDGVGTPKFDLGDRIIGATGGAGQEAYIGGLSLCGL